MYTLTDLLPPLPDDTPWALRARNLAAIAKVVALMPVNANEADLAAQCLAAQCLAAPARAKDVLRLVRRNVRYGSMVRMCCP